VAPGASHPFERIAPGHIRVWLVPLAALALLLLALLPVLLPERETHTLLDLIRAGSVARAEEVLAHWSLDERVRAAHALGLDYLLNPAYLNALALACVWASRRFRAEPLVALGPLLAWLAWSAILANVAENVAVYRMLLGPVAAPWPQVAAAAHYWSGGVIAAGLVYALGATLGARARA